jgi:hypothetical protein
MRNFAAKQKQNQVRQNTLGQAQVTSSKKIHGVAAGRNLRGKGW